MILRGYAWEMFGDDGKGGDDGSFPFMCFWQQAKALCDHTVNFPFDASVEQKFGVDMHSVW